MPTFNLPKRFCQILATLANISSHTVVSIVNVYSNMCSCMYTDVHYTLSITSRMLHAPIYIQVIS